MENRQPLVLRSAYNQCRDWPTVTDLVENEALEKLSIEQSLGHALEAVKELLVDRRSPTLSCRDFR